MAHIFTGTGVAVITPFKSDYSIDAEALKRILNHLVDGKVEYVVMLGTTGESVTLSSDEKKQVMDIALETINGRIPVVIGIGGNNTQEITATINKTDFKGIAGILSVSPYYNKPSQQGLYYHYKAIADVSPLPVILYNVPGRTSSNVTAETTLRLAHDFKNIVAIKEASANFQQCMEIIQGKPEGFQVISGDDPLTLPFISLGMSGLISVIGNAYPLETSDMVRACLAGDYDKGRKLHYKLLGVTDLIFAEGNPAGIKALMEIKGLCSNVLRLPLYQVSEGLYKKLQTI